MMTQPINSPAELQGEALISYTESHAAEIASRMNGQKWHDLATSLAANESCGRLMEALATYEGDKSQTNFSLLNLYSSGKEDHGELIQNILEACRSEQESERNLGMRALKALEEAANGVHYLPDQDGNMQEVYSGDLIRIRKIRIAMEAAADHMEGVLAVRRFAVNCLGSNGMFPTRGLRGLVNA